MTENQAYKDNIHEFDNMVDDQIFDRDSPEVTTESQVKKKRGRPKGVKNSLKLDEQWIPEKG